MHSWRLEHLPLRQLEKNVLQKRGKVLLKKEQACFWDLSVFACRQLPDYCARNIPLKSQRSDRVPFHWKYCAVFDGNTCLRSLYRAWLWFHFGCNLNGERNVTQLKGFGGLKWGKLLCEVSEQAASTTPSFHTIVASIQRVLYSQLCRKFLVLQPVLNTPNYFCYVNKYVSWYMALKLVHFPFLASKSFSLASTLAYVVVELFVSR